MTTLLTQMRPAPSEVQDRRYGVRKYQPDFPLCRYVTIPEGQEKLDPKPPPVRIKVLGEGQPPAGYITTHGHLDPELKDQFSRHFIWKTTTQHDYKRHYPPLPKVTPSFAPRVDMVRSKMPPGTRPPGGPFEYQKMKKEGGELPEKKAWPLVGNYFANFPNNIDGPAPQTRTLKHNIGGRTPEDTAAMREHIRDLVKRKNLNRQYVKPMDHYKGMQKEARIYEGVDLTPNRNPPGSLSEYSCQYNRHLPAKEYQRPEHGIDHVMSRTVVHTKPCNHFNSMEHPPLLDYLPLPFNLTRTPHDIRLI